MGDVGGVQGGGQNPHRAILGEKWGSWGSMGRSGGYYGMGVALTSCRWGSCAASCTQRPIAPHSSAPPRRSSSAPKWEREGSTERLGNGAEKGEIGQKKGEFGGGGDGGRRLTLFPSPELQPIGMGA